MLEALVTLAILVATYLAVRRPSGGAVRPGAVRQESTRTESGDDYERQERRPWKFAGNPVPMMLDPDWCTKEEPHEVPSDSIPGRTWIVTIATRSCTCPDFMKRRASLPAHDIRRLCKHAATVVNDHKLYMQLPPLQRAVLLDRFFPSYDVVHVEQAGAALIAITFRSGEDWVNLFAPRPPAQPDPEVTTDRMPHIRSGYNLRERRWANGQTPRWVKGAGALIRDRFKRG